MFRISQDSALLCSRVALGSLHTGSIASYFVSYLFTLPATCWSKLDLSLDVPAPYPVPKDQLSPRHVTHETLVRGTAPAATEASFSPPRCIHSVSHDAHHVSIWSCVHPALCVHVLLPVSHGFLRLPPKQGCEAPGTQIFPHSFLLL